MLKSLLIVYLLIHISLNQPSIECSKGRLTCDNACTDNYFEDYSSYLIAPGLKENGLGFADFFSEFKDDLGGGLSLDTDTIKKFLKTQTGTFIFGIGFFFIMSILMVIVFFIGAIFIFLSKFLPCICNPNCCPKSKNTCKFVLKAYVMAVGTLMLVTGIVLSVNAFKNVSMDGVKNSISTSYHELDDFPGKVETIIPKIMVTLISNLIVPILYGIFDILPQFQTGPILSNTTDILDLLKEIPTVDSIRGNMSEIIRDLPKNDSFPNVQGVLNAAETLRDTIELDILIASTERTCERNIQLDHQSDHNDEILKYASFPSLFSDRNFGQSNIKNRLACLQNPDPYTSCVDLKNFAQQEIKLLEEWKCPNFNNILSSCKFENTQFYEEKDQCIAGNPISDHSEYFGDLLTKLGSIDSQKINDELEQGFTNISRILGGDIYSIMDNAFNLRVFREIIGNVNNVADSLRILSTQGLRISAVDSMIQQLDKISELEIKINDTIDDVQQQLHGFDLSVLRTQINQIKEQVSELDGIKNDLQILINGGLSRLDPINNLHISNVAAIMTNFNADDKLDDICHDYKDCIRSNTFCTQRDNLLNGLQIFLASLRPYNPIAHERCDDTTNTSCKSEYFGRGVCSNNESPCSQHTDCSPTGTNCVGYVNMNQIIDDYEGVDIATQCSGLTSTKITDTIEPLIDFGGFTKYNDNWSTRIVSMIALGNIEKEIKIKLDEIPLLNDPLSQINDIPREFESKLDQAMNPISGPLWELHNFTSDQGPIFQAPGSSQMIQILNQKLSNYSETVLFMKYIEEFLDHNYKIPLDKLKEINATQYENGQVTQYIDALYIAVDEMFSLLLFNSTEAPFDISFLPDIRSNLQIINDIQRLLTTTDAEKDDKGMHFAGRIASFALNKNVTTSKDDKGSLFKKEDGSSRDGGMCISDTCIANTIDLFIGESDMEIANFKALDIVSGALFLFQIYPILLGTLTFITSLLLAFEFKPFINCSYVTTLLFYFVIGVFFNIICIIILLMYILITALISDLPNIVYTVPGLFDINIPRVGINLSDIGLILGDMLTGCKLSFNENPLRKIVDMGETVIINATVSVIGGQGIGDEMKERSLDLVRDSIGPFKDNLSVLFETIPCQPIFMMYSIVTTTLCSALLFLFHLGAIWWMFVLFEANCPLYACTKCVLNSDKKGPEVFTDEFSDKDLEDNELSDSTVDVPSVTIIEKPDDTLNGLKKEMGQEG